MAKTKQLTGKVAIVCGASTGIGFSTAAEVIRRGGSVAVVARGNGSLDTAVEQLRLLVKERLQFVEAIQADAANRNDIGPKLEAFVTARGVPDYLINAVGFAGPDYVTNLGLDQFRQNMDVNYYGQLIPTLVLLPHLMEAGRGHIAFVSSMMGYFGVIGYAGLRSVQVCPRRPRRGPAS